MPVLKNVLINTIKATSYMISLMEMEHLDLHAKKPTETPNSYNFERCVNPTARLINLCGYQKYRLINRVHIL